MGTPVVSFASSYQSIEELMSIFEDIVLDEIFQWIAG
jgi:hypothetical protein